MTVRETVASQNPQALFYDKRFDDALIGWTLGFGTKSDTRPVAVYDHYKLLGMLAAEFAADGAVDGEDVEESELVSDAQQWIDHNMAGAYFGPDAPVLLTTAATFGAQQARLCLVPDCEDSGAHQAPGGSKTQRLCCKHYEQFVVHVFSPDRNPIFPVELS